MKFQFRDNSSIYEVKGWVTIRYSGFLGLVVITIIILAGCNINIGTSKESTVLEGESADWDANLRIVFKDSNRYQITGNIDFQSNYIPENIRYSVVMPAVELGGGSKSGKEIDIPASLSRIPKETSIQEFTKDVSINILWTSPEGKELKETFKLD